jgi:hypothetical protein
MRLVYTRERKHIGTKWSKITCHVVPLAAQSLERQSLEGSQSHWRLTTAIRNEQCKQINKQYTKQYLISKQTVPTDVIHLYERVSTRIT